MLFIKLGGSLITDKTRPNTPRYDVLAQLAKEIYEFGYAPIQSKIQNSNPKILFGHGSGSFGHAAAKQYGTRDGVHHADGWRGFGHVSVAAAQLNRIVADALFAAGVPVMSFLPSALVRCHDGRIIEMKSDGIEAALSHGLAPLIMGDVAFDEVRGGTITSTEEEFAFLAQTLPVTRVLLAGETEGVYERYPDGPILPSITPANWQAIRGGVGASRGADVTGGMASKVSDMIKLVQAYPHLSIHIFSGLHPGNLTRVMSGEPLGTTIVNG